MNGLQHNKITIQSSLSKSKSSLLPHSFKSSVQSTLVPPADPDIAHPTQDSTAPPKHIFEYVTRPLYFATGMIDSPCSYRATCIHSTTHFYLFQRVVGPSISTSPSRRGNLCLYSAPNPPARSQRLDFKKYTSIYGEERSCVLGTVKGGTRVPQIFVRGRFQGNLKGLMVIFRVYDRTRTDRGL